MNLSAPYGFTLRQLQYIVAVADAASFRRAAEQCAVSQPSLSAQIAQVESVLGVRLFERDKRRVITTAAGARLVDRARDLLISAHDLTETARRFVDPLAGTLRIGVIPTVAPYLLPRITPSLRSRFERLRVTWIEDKTDVLLRSLETGTLDAALLAMGAGMEHLDQAVIGTDPFVLATPTGHRLARSKSLASVKNLKDENILLLDDGHCFRDQALAFCGSVRVKELDFRATSLSTLVQMVAGGSGITLLPALCVPTEIRRADLIVRRFVKPAPFRTLALVWRKQSPMTPALRPVAELIRARYVSRSRVTGN